MLSKINLLPVPGHDHFFIVLEQEEGTFIDEFLTLQCIICYFCQAIYKVVPPTWVEFYTGVNHVSLFSFCFKDDKSKTVRLPLENKGKKEEILRYNLISKYIGKEESCFFFFLLLPQMKWDSGTHENGRKKGRKVREIEAADMGEIRTSWKKGNSCRNPCARMFQGVCLTWTYLGAKQQHDWVIWGPIAMNEWMSLSPRERERERDVAFVDVTKHCCSCLLWYFVWSTFLKYSVA